MPPFIFVVVVILNPHSRYFSVGFQRVERKGTDRERAMLT